MAINALTSDPSSIQLNRRVSPSFVPSEPPAGLNRPSDVEGPTVDDADSRDFSSRDVSRAAASVRSRAGDMAQRVGQLRTNLDQRLDANLGIDGVNSPDAIKIASATGKHKIEQSAPWGKGRGTIHISVQELRGSELGTLQGSRAQNAKVIREAFVNKSREDLATYGKTTAQLKSDAIKSKYFNSPAHQAWAKAAEARVGGRISADQWMNFDPFGGTAGNGPQIMWQGKYPGPLAKIAMAHDTDWSLGRGR